jgi:hypothetical protein
MRNAAGRAYEARPHTGRRGPTKYVQVCSFCDQRLRRGAPWMLWVIYTRQGRIARAVDGSDAA